MTDRAPQVQELLKLLGLEGRHVRSLSLRFAASELVTVKTEEYVDSGIESFAPTVRDYVLIKREEYERLSAEDPVANARRHLGKTIEEFEELVSDLEDKAGLWERRARQRGWTE